MRILVSVFAAAALLTACASDEEKAARAGADAEQALQLGDFPRARASALEAIRSRDDVATYWLTLGRSSLALEEYGSAFTAFQRASELDRGNIEALRAVAQLALSGGKLDQAVEAADQLLLLAPGDPNAILIKGFAALRRRSFNQALEQADTVLKRAPTNEAAQVLKARILFEQGMRPEAIDLVEDAVRTSGTTTLRLQTLHQFYTRVDNSEQLIRIYRRRLQLEPQNQQLQIEFARLLFSSGSADAGFRFIQPLLDTPAGARLAATASSAPAGTLKGPEFLQVAARAPLKVKIALASAALDQGLHNEVRSLLVGYADVPISTDTVDAVAAHATAMSHSQGVKAAERRLAEVLMFDPDNPIALSGRAQLSLRRRDLAQALRDAQVLVRDNPHHFAFRKLLADVYRARREEELVGLTLRKAYRDLPRNKEARAAYVRYLTDKGDLIGAAQAEEAAARAEAAERENLNQ